MDRRAARHGQRVVPIIDVAIPLERSDAYWRGRELDVYLKNRQGEDYVGKVWPGHSVFPDFTAPNTQRWWTEGYSNFSSVFAFDGIWNGAQLEPLSPADVADMNEASNFCSGPCGPEHSNQLFKDLHDFDRCARHDLCPCSRRVAAITRRSTSPIPTISPSTTSTTVC